MATIARATRALPITTKTMRPMPGAGVEPARAWRMVFLGLTVTSSWGNGHATTYRALCRALGTRRHDVLFLERDVPWYAEHRDEKSPNGYRVELYDSLDELKDRYGSDVRDADVVIVGSYVPEGHDVVSWVLRTARGITGFYDIDTPITLARLESGDEEFIGRDHVPRLDLYLSFTGGPVLDRLRREFGARRPCALYCSVDPARHAPFECRPHWELGYLGTYASDRQSALHELLLDPARVLRTRRFVVAGPQYLPTISWPLNVDYVDHLAPDDHPLFYGGQRFTLNITRKNMAEAGYSPSVRLFEAAACGVPILTDRWEGMDEFFAPGKEVLVVRNTHEVVAYLCNLPETERQHVASRARARVLAQHTADARARQLESYITAASK
jgi:spore maturation protein CgeB